MPNRGQRGNREVAAADAQTPGNVAPAQPNQAPIPGPQGGSGFGEGRGTGGTGSGMDMGPSPRGVQDAGAGAGGRIARQIGAQKRQGPPGMRLFPPGRGGMTGRAPMHTKRRRPKGAMVA